MTVEDNIRLDAKRLTDIGRNMSISQAKRVVYDFGFLSSLIEAAEIDKLFINGNFKDADDLENIVYSMENHLEEVERLANRVLKMFRSIDFYCYYDSGYQSLKPKHKIDVLFSFLDEFFPELLMMYKDMRESNHIFIADLDDDLGQSYSLQSIDSYYVAIHYDQDNDITNLETLIHEMLHVYSMHFLRNYGWKKTQKLLNAFSGETIPLYGELAFFDYLVRNNIIKESAYFHRNELDYNILYFFKVIKYFCYLARIDKDQFYFPDGLTYEYRGKKTIKIYDGVPFMGFDNEDLKKSGLVNFAYGIGSIEAYNLLKQHRRGAKPKEIIDNFLISQDDPDHMEKSIFNSDLSFMRDEIKHHQLVLEGIRPIPGYHRK